MRILPTVSLVFLALVTCTIGQTEEKYEFQSDVSRLMDILVNSLYQKKEVFLREVISNSADALDKIRFLAISDSTLLSTKPELEIRISFDEELKTLTVRDTGIGMTKQELISNLGTVAKSGTTNFVEQLAETGDLNLVGQFGVGFYSVYLVADKVTVRSKNNDDEQYIWESSADSTFTVSKDPEGDTLGRGTEITMHLKEDAMEYADQNRLENLVKRYSEFIGFPIYLNKKTTKMVDVDDDEDSEDVDEDEEDEDFDEEDDETEQEPESEKKEVTTWKWERLNSQGAIWTRNPQDVSEEEYSEFYKVISHEFEAPLTHTHFKAEGEVEFRSLLYVPKKAPYDLFEDYYSKKSGLKLYVRKVLIKDDFEDLMPRYLNFIKGVVDSDDLPLSVSRETLQQQKAIKVISKKLVRKAIDMLKRMSDAEMKHEVDEEEDVEEEEVDEREIASYADFYKEFGKNIKLGVVEDQTNRPKLAKLLRFKSTKTEFTTESKPVSLDEYISRMQDWQKDIYFLTGDSLHDILQSPFLRKAQDKNLEVLILDDPVDEYVVQQLTEYEGHKLQSLSKEGVKFGDESNDDKLREKAYKKKFKDLTKWMKDVYNTDKTNRVEKVVVSATRSTADTPAVIVAGQHGYSANMERIMKSQALGDQARMQYARRIVELNPRHPIVSKLNEVFQEDEEQAKDIAWLLYDSASVASGFEIDRPRDFAQGVYRMLKRGLSLNSLDLDDLIEVEPEEPAEEPVEKEEL